MPSSLNTLAAALLLGAAPLAAHAATFTFAGQVPTGTDPLGGVYAAGPFGGGLVNFEETAGLQPDPTQQVLFNPSAAGLENATSFTLTETGTVDPILSLSAGFGVFFETYTPDSHFLSVWNATENAAGTSVTFTAPTGEALLPGERFSTDVTFSEANTLPAGFAFDVTWGGAVPEPQSWALMILGAGAAGAALRRRRAGLAAA